ncbi:hypothetical protein GQS40_08690|uniref:4-hydroxy-tetrahydrodipicolinate reductase n=1 Tax=Leuconostoc lactis TaxID=1246 RepID=A0A6L7ABG5_LEULA|nr:hypothetical protein [Leuconostoc lactis]
MQFSELAARYFPDVEIVEAHNPKKIDAPSGTAVTLMDSAFEIVGILSGHAHDSAYPVWTALSEIDQPADIFLDVSTPATVYDNAVWAIAHDMAVVIGATAISLAIPRAGEGQVGRTRLVAQHHAATYSTVNS